jgi:antitoxin component of MazEF toxin-antitoxin module
MKTDGLADFPPIRYTVSGGVLMATVQFKLPIGAKRQVTIPRDCMDLLSLEEGGELLLEVVGDHAVLLPVVSIARRDLPEELRKKYLSRRGEKSSDIPLSQFLSQIGYNSAEGTPPRKGSAAAKKKRALRGEPVSRGSALKSR